MRRIVSSLGRGCAEWLRSIATAWNAFWFTPSDQTVLGFLQILTGLMLLYTHAVWGLDLQAFFGPEGWHSSEAVKALQSDQFVFSYWWWVPSEWMLVAHVTALAVLGLFTVGLWTRLTSILFLCHCRLLCPSRAGGSLWS